MFDPTTRPDIYPTIPDDATSIVRSLSKTIHKYLWHYFNLHEAAELGCHTFIIEDVEDTWIRKLQHSDTIYADFATKALMDHLQLRCGGLHTLDIFDLISEMLTYYGDTAGVPEYTNIIKESPKRRNGRNPPSPMQP